MPVQIKKYNDNYHNNMLHLYSGFLGTQSAFYGKGNLLNHHHYINIFTPIDNNATVCLLLVLSAVTCQFKCSSLSWMDSDWLAASFLSFISWKENCSENNFRMISLLCDVTDVFVVCSVF